MQRKWNLKLVLFLTLLGAIGIIAIIPYEITTLMNQEIYISNPESISVPFVVIVNSIIQTVFLFILVLLGVRFQKRVGLNASLLETFIYKKKLPTISKKWLIRGIVVTFILSLITILADIFIFAPLIETEGSKVPVTIWWQGLLAILYGGITEELMLRLFGMSFLVWFFAWITKKEKLNIPNSFFYIAIFLAAIIFGLGHLPATIEVFGELTPILVMRALVLNGLLGLWFGYLYWRKGLEYAIIAHISADLFIHVLFSPLFY